MESRINSGTITRTIILFMALLNQLFAIFGRPQVTVNEDLVYQVVSILFTIGSTLWAWWKNNSFTKEAIAADKVMLTLKAKNNTK